MFTHVNRAYKYALRCMFVPLFLWLPGWNCAGFPKYETAEK